MFHSNKIVLVFSYGRSCSTLVTNLFNSDQEKATVSQEISFEVMIKILIKKFHNKSYIIDKEIVEYFLLLKKYISDSNERKYLPKNPHYRYDYDIQIPKEGKIFETFEDMSEFIFQELFCVKSKIVGCKILIDDWEDDLNEVVKIFEKNSNIFPVLVLRDYQDMSKSRISRNFPVIEKTKYDNFVSNNKLPVIRVEDMENSFKKVLVNMDVDFNRNKFDEFMRIKHSY